MWCGRKGPLAAEPLLLAVWAVCLDSAPWDLGLPVPSQGLEEWLELWKWKKETFPSPLFADKKQFYEPTVLSSPLGNVSEETGGLWEVYRAARNTPSFRYMFPM